MKNLYQKIIKQAFVYLSILHAGNGFSQTQNISVSISPTISKSIKGHLKLDRKKYINLASNVNEVNRVMNSQRFEKYFRDYDISLGRALGMVFFESKYGNSLREDSHRPGYVDTAYLAEKLNPTDNGLDQYLNAFGNSQGLSLHDRAGNHENNTYPAFIPMYTNDNGHLHFPENNEAHAEMVAHIMKEKYTDFQRPEYYELVNEPSWQYWNDRRFYEFHIATKRKFKAMNISTEVGGPCYPIGYYFKQNFGAMNGITKFIDGTHFELDFYSFHIYDYLHWNFNVADNVGSISSGLPTEAVFDALAAYTFNKYGKEFTFVGSEHGGYNGDKANKEAAADSLANIYFPRSEFDSDFEWEMEKRSISNFVLINSAIANTLTFMNHPHIVKKTVPFIFSETSNWDPRYYASLLVKENFDKANPNWVESKLIYFYRYFKDVKGRRVQSICNDNDIQHFSFVNNDTLIMLFHNQSNDQGKINIKIDDFGVKLSNLMIRRLGKRKDHRPYFTEEKLGSLNDIKIGKQESLVVFADYNTKIPNNQTLNIIPLYSKESAVEFTGSKNFTVDIPNYNQVKYAELRVGIGRQVTNDEAKNIDIYLNGTKLNIPIENSAERLTNYSSNPKNSSYATTKMITLNTNLLQKSNTITVRFADGGTGGVGAVVIRAGFSDDV